MLSSHLQAYVIFVQLDLFLNSLFRTSALAFQVSCLTLVIQLASSRCRIYKVGLVHWSHNVLELSQPFEPLLTNHRVDAVKFRVAIWVHVLLAPRVNMVPKMQSVTTQCDLFEQPLELRAF